MQLLNHLPCFKWQKWWVIFRDPLRSIISHFTKKMSKTNPCKLAYAKWQYAKRLYAKRLHAKRQYAKRGLCQKAVCQKGICQMTVCQKGTMPKSSMPNDCMPKDIMPKDCMPNDFMPFYCPAFSQWTDFDENSHSVSVLAFIRCALVTLHHFIAFISAKLEFLVIS